MVEPDTAQALVVSGFLGSGKTTLVRHLLEESQRQGIRTAVVSNEFGELGIDEALLADAAADYVELSGGCVCCRLSDDLLRTLQQLWERARPQRVIVETSGVALPYDTLLNFWRDPVRSWARDETAIVVVSAEQVAAGRDLDAVFVDQICSADLLVLNKTDLVSAQECERAGVELRQMQSDVEVVRCRFGRIDERIVFPPSPTGAAQRGESDAPADGRRGSDRRRRQGRSLHPHEDYRSLELTVDAVVDLEALLGELRQRGALRVKGFVATAAGVRVVQGVAGRIEIQVPPVPPPAQLVGRLMVIERAGAGLRSTHGGAAGATTSPTGAQIGKEDDNG
ncbi:MAG: GTP-binding protein [Deltaproteobacteria bacterium]|nr:GTP-binding protein [Deltaproteobacteria bacterium]